nr:zinc finger, CCHC-type, retrotransposon Gag domain protein [Tanacetum cinerariifolium]
PLVFRSATTPAEAEDWITHMEKLFQVFGFLDNFMTRLAAFKLEGDALSWWKAHLRTQKWVLDRIVNTDYTNVAAAARNIELLHESGNSNKQDRDGNRVENRGQGQQEIRGCYDQGQHVYRGRQDQSVEYKGRQDRGY